jgi:hypothetical protein
MPRAFAARLAVLGGIALAPSIGFAQMQHDGHTHAGSPPAPAAFGKLHFPIACPAVFDLTESWGFPWRP